LGHQLFKSNHHKSGGGTWGEDEGKIFPPEEDERSYVPLDEHERSYVPPKKYEGKIFPPILLRRSVIPLIFLHWKKMGIFGAHIHLKNCIERKVQVLKP